MKEWYLVCILAGVKKNRPPRHTICPNEPGPREVTPERPEELFATVMILDIGFMDQHAHDQPRGIDEQMPLAPYHMFAAIVAALPSISRVYKIAVVYMPSERISVRDGE